MRRPLPFREKPRVEGLDDLLSLLASGLQGDNAALRDALDATEAQPELAEHPQAAPDHPLVQLLRVRMPFGRFNGTALIDLPEEYLVWFAGEGFPAGRLGQQMALVYEIKRNGLEALLAPLR